jgi:hypothetical protein
MEFQVTTLNDHVRITVQGVFAAEAGRACVEAAYAACAQSGQTRVLFDARGLPDTNVSISDRFALAMHLADLHDLPLRCAVVVPTALMTTKTLEHTASNRGAPVKTTDSMAEACAWLGIAPVDG